MSAVPEPVLPDRPFTLREAAEHGIPDRVLRRRHLARPLWGVRSTREPQSLADRCRATLVAAPAGSVVSHVTAARLHRIWLPADLLEPEVVHVMLAHEANRLRRRTVVAHRGLERRAVTLVEGVPVTAAPDTLGRPGG